MALKRTVREKCEKCEQRAARKIGDRIIDLAHRCPKRPPGPPTPPFTFYASEIIFEPGEFEPAFLQRELEEAWSIINDLREKRWQAERSAKDAVESAMRAVYDPGRPAPHHGSGPAAS